MNNALRQLVVAIFLAINIAIIKNKTFLTEVVLVAGQHSWVIQAKAPMWIKVRVHARTHTHTSITGLAPVLWFVLGKLDTHSLEIQRYIPLASSSGGPYHVMKRLPTTAEELASKSARKSIQLVS